MQPMQHQMMGYDRAITMFSPDGRLLQVEYAKKTVKQGSTAIGISCKDGVVLVTDKRIIDSLIISDSVEKIWEIDEHIIATAAGIIPDARVLVERSQARAQQHRITFDTPTEVISIVKDIANLMQVTTQSGGYRPFGVSLLIAGVDKDGVRLYSTDPVGVYSLYHATAIGEKGDEAIELLREKYDKDISVKQGILLAVDILKQVLGDKLDVKRVDCAYVDSSQKAHHLSEADIEGYLK